MNRGWDRKRLLQPPDKVLDHRETDKLLANFFFVFFLSFFMKKCFQTRTSDTRGHMKCHSSPGLKRPAGGMQFVPLGGALQCSSAHSASPNHRL